MAKDNAQTIGSLVLHAGVRDAIHVPIISVTAAETLSRGESVSINAAMEAAPCIGGIGVVDPYLSAQQVAKGEKVWILIRPGSISTLTHQWTHRLLPEAEAQIPDTELAGDRLREFAERELGWTLEKMLEKIEDVRNGGDPAVDWGFEGVSVYETFWDDFVKYTGKPDPNEEAQHFFFFHCGGCS